MYQEFLFTDYVTICLKKLGRSFTLFITVVLPEAVSWLHPWSNPFHMPLSLQKSHTHKMLDLCKNKGQL